MEPSARLLPRRDNWISREENGSMNSPRTKDFRWNDPEFQQDKESVLAEWEESRRH